MKKHLQLPPVLIICIFCIFPFITGLSQPYQDYLGDFGISKRVISDFITDCCKYGYNAIQDTQGSNQEVYKRFLFHYSKARGPAYSNAAGFSPVHPLMRLAPKLSERRMKRYRDPGTRFRTAELRKKDTLGTHRRPFFLFRPRNGRNAKRSEQ
ncbi:neuromedin-S isoform X1 [Protopterus annectens]|uniref:neuromedin-S isoform X1 n=1 Tax=Protopterus annectens TaxID=7888 RepID=UPI001CFB560B|nr:neuromedin-S isoform X1 [Protopterus annectens]